MFYMKQSHEYTIYKISSNIERSYIISLQTGETILYYLLRFSDNTPVIERITNALAFLNSNNANVEKIDKQVDEYRAISSYINAIQKSQLTPQRPFPRTDFTSPLSPKDYSILKLK